MTLPNADEDDSILATVGYVYGMLGNKGEAESYLDRLMQSTSKQYVEPQWVAMVYAGLGDSSHALEWLERGYEEHGYLSTLKGDPVWDSIHHEPRFQAILRKIGLE
jgi:tetratricopeptide (TPR) repeat protein